MNFSDFTEYEIKIMDLSRIYENISAEIVINYYKEKSVILDEKKTEKAIKALEKKKFVKIVEMNIQSQKIIYKIMYTMNSKGEIRDEEEYRVKARSFQNEICP